MEKELEELGVPLGSKIVHDKFVYVVTGYNLKKKLVEIEIAPGAKRLEISGAKAKDGLQKFIDLMPNKALHSYAMNDFE